MAAFPGELSKSQIEEKARAFGMVYRDEVIVYDSDNAIQDKAKNSEKSELRTVQIDSGLTLQEVGRILENKEIIKDKGRFVELVQKLGLSDKLLAGTYIFRPGEDTYEVILTITGRRGGRD